MDMGELTGKCFSSQEIRLAISNGIIRARLDEERIQPSSFEPVVTDELFIMDTEEGGFRSNIRETVYRSLLQLPKRQRERVSITNGFELKKGFSYLIPLEDKIKVFEGLHIRSSPKSSLGRLFLNTRLVSDFGNCYDEINHQYTAGREVGLWLYVQPLAFNVIVHPGLSLNQLRFINGYESKINPKDMEKLDFLFRLGDDGGLVPARKIISDGLEIHLDLEGKNTSGIVGLRARKNPTPIDLSRKEAYAAEDFFEPKKSDNGRLLIKRGEHYLLSSNEVFRVPKDISLVLRTYADGYMGPTHFAGFVDNGFIGDLVFELRSEEASETTLVHGMAISKVDAYRTNIPDKLYGEGIGSNYQEQIGCKPSKYFVPFDYGYAAKNYARLERIILVEDANLFNRFRRSSQGFEFMDMDSAQELCRMMEGGFFHSRYDCEYDEAVLQPIAYQLVFGEDNTIFSYVRTDKLQKSGEGRLHKKHSIGIGGHINKTDGPDFIRKGMLREKEKELAVDGELRGPYFLGTIMAQDKPVDKVHFGLVYAWTLEGEVRQNDESIISGTMRPIKEIQNDGQYPLKFETWSRILIPKLGEIYEKIQAFGKGYFK